MTSPDALQPPPSLTGALARSRRASAGVGRRVALPCVAIVVHAWHLFNDSWYESPVGAVAHVTVSIGLVALAWNGYRPLAALLALGQPALLAALLGAVDAIRSPSDGPGTHVVYRREFQAGDGCLLEPDTRLVSCPAIGWAGCVPPLFDYTAVNMAAATLLERTFYAMFGSPSTSYMGPLPSPPELRELASRVQPTLLDNVAIEELAPEAVDEVLLVARSKSDTASDGLRLRVVPLGSGVIVVADEGLTWTQLRLTGDRGTLPGYHDVDLLDAELRGDRWPEM